MDILEQVWKNANYRTLPTWLAQDQIEPLLKNLACTVNPVQNLLWYKVILTDQQWSLSAETSVCLEYWLQVYPLSQNKQANNTKLAEFVNVTLNKIGVEGHHFNTTVLCFHGKWRYIQGYIHTMFLKIICSFTLDNVKCNE